MDAILRLLKPNLERSDVCPELLDNLLGMLRLSRYCSLIVTDRRLQPSDFVQKSFLKLLDGIIQTAIIIFYPSGKHDIGFPPMQSPLHYSSDRLIYFAHMSSGIFSVSICQRLSIETIS